MNSRYEYLEQNRAAILANQVTIQQLKLTVEQLEIIRNKNRLFLRKK